MVRTEALDSVSTLFARRSPSRSSTSTSVSDFCHSGACSMSAAISNTRSTGGPDAATRAKSTSVVLAEARDAGGTVLAEARLEGINGYDLTARFLAWGAQTAARGGLQGTGALGPVDCFGLEALEAGCAEAGLARVS